MFSLSRVGQQVAHYRVVEQLGAGGMGVVYKALDTKLGRHVALKFLPHHISADAGTKARFLREARAAAALDHTNVGAVHGIEETEDGQMFIVMSYYEGRPLSAMMGAPLPAGEAISIARQIALGLAAAHRQGIIHRDIKPSNILITPEGIVKIVDFGLARSSEDEPLTATGATLGTAQYMSPEQAMGNALDQRTDLWSLGVVLCQMLTGSLPFRGDSAHSLLYNIVHEPPSIGSLPANIRPIVERALAKDLAQRYARAEEFNTDLDAVQAGRPLAPVTETLTSLSPPPAVRGRPGKRLLVSTAALIAAALLVVMMLPSWRNRLANWIRPGSLAASEKHIVVLPFTNVGNDPANAALCDGLTEVLTSRLTGLEEGAPSLWVVPAGEVRRRKVTGETEALKEFNAALVIAGSVQKSSSGVRLTINLEDPMTMHVLGSRISESATGDLLAVEDEAVKSIGQLMSVSINPGAARTAAAAVGASPAAYELYLGAKGLLQRSDKPENIDFAIRNLNTAVEQNPNFALGYSGLADAYWSKWITTKDAKWLDATVQNAKKALALDRQLAPAYVALARAQDASRDPQAAIAELEQALKLDPRNETAHRAMARSFEAMGRIQEAEKGFRAGIEIHPDYWDGYNQYAAFLFRQGRLKEAEQQYRRAIEIAPDNATLYSNLGAVLYTANQMDEARRAFETAVRLTPTYFALSNLANVQDKEGRYTDAARTYERALKLNDRDYRPWGNLAWEYQRLNDPRARATLERARTMAEAALKREPRAGSPVIVCDLAYFNAKLGSPEKARQFADQATLLAPDNPQVLLRTALAYELSGVRDRALKNIAQGLKKGLSLKAIQTDSELAGLVADRRFPDIIAQAKPQLKAGQHK